MPDGLTFELYNILGYLEGDSKIVLAKFHENLLRIDREIREKHALQVNVTWPIFFYCSVVHVLQVQCGNSSQVSSNLHPKQNRVTTKVKKGQTKSV